MELISEALIQNFATPKIIWETLRTLFFSLCLVCFYVESKQNINVYNKTHKFKNICLI